MSCLYKISGPDERCYIGITSKTAEQRFKGHIFESSRKIGSKYLQNAILKYGKEAFSVKTLVISNDWDYLNDLEVKAIAAYGTIIPNGYNISPGGKQSTSNQETRTKISAALKGKKKTAQHIANMIKSLTGVTKGIPRGPFSERHKINLSLSKKGVKRSEEVKARMRLAAAAKPKKILSEKHKANLRIARARRVMSQETRAKISAANKGRIITPEWQAKINATKDRHRQEKLMALTPDRNDYQGIPNVDLK